MLFLNVIIYFHINTYFHIGATMSYADVKISNTLIIS